MALVTVKTFSKALRTKTDIQVILPTPLTGEVMGTAMGSQFERRPGDGLPAPMNYYSPDLKCPVLYLLHGTFGDDGDWMRFSRIESYAQDYNVAVVMPDAENSMYRNMGRGGPAYYDYFTDELPRMMQWMFPISDKREDTFIAGLSMGGSGAFRIGMSRPDLFSHVASLSGGFSLTKDTQGKTVWTMAYEPGEKLDNTIDDPFWLANEVLNKPNCPELYLCCGTEDFIYQDTVAMKKHLDSIGFKYTYHEQPGIHNWDFWDDEIKRILEWLPISRR